MKTLRAWWFVIAGVALLVLRKPWALHTPQLHAEDGSVFLQQDDQLGAGAIFLPYQGYLHLLPRLIAWLASHTADPAWWPAIYNGTAFLITAAMLARFASPRLDLPGKPWLVLAFALVPHTGEVFFTITNLQWLTAFVLLQQVLMARPVTWAQRIADLAILALVGLTGPFAILFLPLFAWRAWRERHTDALAALAVVAACAAVQGALVLRTGFHSEAATPHSSPGVLFAVLGCRLFVWPVFGLWGAYAESVAGRAVIGCGAVGALAVWALRPDPRRLLRAQVLVALALVTVACLARVRPDRWETVNVVIGDRYFYMSRVLVAWLLIWEFDAVPRGVARAARALCVIGALANLPGFRLPASPDYHWAEHCDPIRRGVPANINTLPEGWFIEYPGRPKK